MSIMIKTKIVCTIGPASNSYEKIEKLIQEGMDVARLNFSHGRHEEHRQVIENIRQVSLKTNKPVAILQDLGGPKIRIGEIEKEPIFLKEGSSFILTNREVPGDEQEVSVTFPSLPQKVKRGDCIFLADGTLELKVKELTSTDIICWIVRGGKLSSHKGVNIPNISMDIPSLTEKDYQDILFGIKNRVDFIGLSFIRNAEDVLRARKILKENRAEDISLIAKIEKKEAIDNLKEIIEVSDGIMIARGDLGVEIPLENVPLVQKDIINRPSVPIIAASTRDSTVRKLALSWGVYPFKADELENTDDMIEKSKKIALKTGLANSGDKIVITAGIPFKIPGTTNLLKVETL
ncbi:MAG: pyruvate kinase [Candidatus Atribacteria bacterium]|nr:pyruvate kinase [Candidatus Atribacteria bacterium]